MKKCNLSEMWQKQIKANALKKEKAAKSKELDALQEQRVKLEKDGWLFKIESWSHPHSSKDHLEMWFKSPRMQFFSIYHSETDLIEVEAKAMSLRESYSYDMSTEVKNILTKYFKENPAATKGPKIKVTIEN